MPEPIESAIEPVPLSETAIDDEFWGPRIRTNRDVTIEHQYEQLEESGCLDNLRRAAGDLDGEFEGYYFADTDAYKWLEAASYTYAAADDPDPDLDSRMDDVIELVAAAQEDDGYLDSFFTVEHPDEKWTNLAMLHELYCAGHLFEAAAAHHRATGKDSLLDVAVDFADHIDERFGPDGERGYPGHEEIEIGLVKLHHVTGDDRYLSLVEYFLEERGQEPSLFEQELDSLSARAGSEELQDGYKGLLTDREGEYDGRYAQDHAPVREQDTVEGHAVRATYLYSGMVDVAMETGDEELFAAAETLWENMRQKRMYVTGGIGDQPSNEGFSGDDYSLPNHSSYAETCAQVGSIRWNHRLFQATGEAAYVDVIERTLYNAFLSGVSLSGDEFFYGNPHASGGDRHRSEWFDCACCPPNLARQLASFGELVYATDGTDDIYVNLYVGSETSVTVDGTPVTLTQKTDYPWDGEVTISVEPQHPTEFTLNLRVPEWCRDLTVEMDGTSEAVDTSSGFIELEHTWENETVTLDLQMPVERVRAHPDVKADVGRVAFRRGPLVYCLEATDNDLPVDRIVVPDDGDVEASYRPDLLDGVTVLEGDALALDDGGWENQLYRRSEAVETTSGTFTAVPYYAWDNRDPGAMRVWLRTE